MDVPDPKDIAAVNLPDPQPAETPAAPDPPSSKPAAKPADEFAVLRDHFAAMVADAPHPLEKPAEEPVAPEATAAETPPPATPPIAPAPATAAQAHPDHLLEAARNLGINEKHLAPGVLPSHVLLDWVVRERLKDATLAARPLADAKATPEVDEDEETLAALEKEGLDAKVSNLFRKQAAKIKELSARDPAKIANEVISQREAATAGERAIDGSFGSAGEQYAEIFGTGSMADLANEEHREARLAVVQRAGIDWQRDNAATIKQKVGAAITKVYGRFAKKAPAPPASPAGAYEAPKAPNGKPPPTTQEWDDASLGRPNGKPKSKQEIGHRQVLQDFYRDNGLGVSDGPPDPLEGVPD